MATGPPGPHRRCHGSQLSTSPRKHTIPTHFRDPFGEADCESEVAVLKEGYASIYFEETPFNQSAVDEATYLIVGRRGAGKTALSQSFSFQKVYGDHVYLDVDEPTVFSQVLDEVAQLAGQSSEFAIPKLQKLWEYVIWSLIFERLRGESAEIAEACRVDGSDRSPSALVARLIASVLDFFRGEQSSQAELLVARLLSAEQVHRARERTFEIARRRKVIIAIDTLEKYEIRNEGLMYSIAALVQCAAAFNRDNASRGIHVKVFMAGEVFPHLREQFLQNPAKSIKRPVFLLWRPKDLLRLICWRYHRYLVHENMVEPDKFASVVWDNYLDVHGKVWKPYFGARITNGFGLAEPTFSYVLRHTQKRPRQLILVCNKIASRARASGTLPAVSEVDIRTAVHEAELELADEIANSYKTVYPNVARIIDALMRVPILFDGKELDRRARQSASLWPPGEYSPDRFRQLVAELGIVGRIRRRDEQAGYVEADFEYCRAERLPLTQHDECVIHPMFFRRLDVATNTRARIMPFTDEAELRQADVE